MGSKYGLKKWVFRLILWVIIFGAIVPYFAEVICSIWFPDAVLGLNVWNQFVSIVLGIVATVLSIVSLIMSFKNYDDTLAIQEKYTETLKQSEIALEKITSIAGEIGKLREDFNRFGIKKDTHDDVASIADDTEWDKEPTQNQ